MGREVRPKTPKKPQGNESRLIADRAEDLEQVQWIPRGPLAPSLDGSLVVGLPYQVESEVADDSHVFGPVASAQSGLVLIERHVEGPVKVVLDGPVAAYGVREG